VDELGKLSINKTDRLKKMDKQASQFLFFMQR